MISLAVDCLYVIMGAYMPPHWYWNGREMTMAPRTGARHVPFDPRRQRKGRKKLLPKRDEKISVPAGDP
jgi:hypothetical protein